MVEGSPTASPAPVPEGAVHRESSSDDKIALFRSRFRGREDVYARRFESVRTGRSGYAPACGNEWVPGVCAKPRIACAECPHRRFLAVTDAVIRWHLSGRDPSGKPFVMGSYPLLLDETCHFVAADFDGDGWRDDLGTFAATARRLEIPMACERSRSGNGGHAWIFFSEAVPAVLARKLASWILTEAMEARPEIGLASYDRLFPNQDTLPRGGFGNLIALPLQRMARDQGNTLFLDETLTPHPDPWQHLSSLRRLSLSEVESRVRTAEATGRILGVRVVPEEGPESRSPWSLPPSRPMRSVSLPALSPLPDRLDLVLGDQIYLAKAHLTPALRNRLIRLAAFQNPEFYRKQAMRLPTFQIPRIISAAEDHPDHLALPRGCLEEVRQLAGSLKIPVSLRDERHPGSPLAVTFQGTLRPEQQAAAAALQAHDIGVLAATTAFGKTVLAAWLIAARAVNTLVIVHRRQLLEQWVERLSDFLGVPAKSIGRLGGGRRRLTGGLDVALIQSLVRKGTVDDRVANYGHVIVDECHHVSAVSFEWVVRRARARFVTGLSATVTRKDGHHPLILMQCGPIRYRVDARRQAAARPFRHEVIVRPTGFRPIHLSDPDPRVEFQNLYAALAGEDRRNAMICADVLSALREGRCPLVLTERTDHLERLAERLRPEAPHLAVLRGGLGRRALAEVLASLEADSPPGPRLLLATGRFIGEGFDDPRLDTLFLTLPVSWHGTVAQYVGRLHRLHHDKRVVRVYDYADLDVPMLSRMFDRRCRGYEAVGYAILLPGSALPGWPAEVPLPVDPAWKQDYAASVRRLIRDGVDVPLGRLFVAAARSPEPEATGVARARSASEAFLYRRLETLSETAGRFGLNARLPIAFDGEGGMEVDFLCEAARLVVELDGDQHLADAGAYRRDRRKDALLQEHGYLVLRFLCADIGSHLDEVLDAILRALTRARRSPGTGQ
ncbi:MAG: DUF559 domain-containing protein [Verrucomicrobia bacterium]|nr:DUF559 domain-containing protein [Verrucomicrobiota bacterium]